jgi:hypothetical protein
MVRIIFIVVGVLMILVGLMWIGQGLHIGPAFIMHGPMVSHRRWTLFGSILGLVGLGLAIWGARRKA